MRVEVYIFNLLKSLSLKFPGIRDIFSKIEPFIFDLFKILNLKAFFGKNTRVSNSLNEEIILKFNKFYKKNYFNNDVNEIIEYLEKRIRSAWRGHHYFSLWLVKELQPLNIVDLGVDNGFSTFIFAAQKIGCVYGIDWFKKDNYRGEKKDAYFEAMIHKKRIEKKFEIKNIKIIQGLFSDVVRIWKNPIDILHIDGSHNYEDVKEDYLNWSKFLKENGVILFHDTNMYEGVKNFFNELDLPKYNFTHSYGLGVISKNEELILKIKEIWHKVNS